MFFSARMCTFLRHISLGVELLEYIRSALVVNTKSFSRMFVLIYAVTNSELELLHILTNTLLSDRYVVVLHYGFNLHLLFLCI